MQLKILVARPHVRRPCVAHRSSVFIFEQLAQSAYLHTDKLKRKVDESN